MAFWHVIFFRSLAEIGAFFIHLVPLSLSLYGQSIANSILSAPISIIEQARAELEKFPLVVIKKFSQKTILYNKKLYHKEFKEVINF